MALMQITIIPMGTATPSVGDHVAEVRKLLDTKQVECQLSDMGTVIQGTAEELMQLALDIHEVPFNMGAPRVVTNITLDDRRDKVVKLGGKTEAVLQRLNNKK